jgi:hypothetical protein
MRMGVSDVITGEALSAGVLRSDTKGLLRVRDSGSEAPKSACAVSRGHILAIEAIEPEAT